MKNYHGANRGWCATAKPRTEKHFCSTRRGATPVKRYFVRLRLSYLARRQIDFPRIWFAGRRLVFATSPSLPVLQAAGLGFSDSQLSQIPFP
jgi:hypothetical protein